MFLRAEGKVRREHLAGLCSLGFVCFGLVVFTSRSIAQDTCPVPGGPGSLGHVVEYQVTGAHGRKCGFG